MIVAGGMFHTVYVNTVVIQLCYKTYYLFSGVTGNVNSYKMAPFGKKYEV